MAKELKTRLHSLEDLDNRTKAYRRTRELIDSIEADLGGADRLSTAERQLVQAAAMHGAMLEHMAAEWISGEPIDELRYVAIANGQRRLLVELGLKRQARDVTPDLKSYIARKERS